MAKNGLFLPPPSLVQARGPAQERGCCKNKFCSSPLKSTGGLGWAARSAPCGREAGPSPPVIFLPAARAAARLYSNVFSVWVASVSGMETVSSPTVMRMVPSSRGGINSGPSI